MIEHSASVGRGGTVGSANAPPVTTASLSERKKNDPQIHTRNTKEVCVISCGFVDRL